MTKNSFDHTDIARSGQGTLFPGHKPRLPVKQMLMLDGISDIRDTGGKYNKGYIHAEMDVRPDLWFFDCHFVGDPVMPGCLGLDGMWQLTGFFLSWQGHDGYARALGAGEIKFFGQILRHNKQITYTIDIKRVIVRKNTMGLCVADGAISVDNKPIYSAQDLKVGVFPLENIPDASGTPS